MIKHENFNSDCRRWRSWKFFKMLSNSEEKIRKSNVLLVISGLSCSQMGPFGQIRKKSLFRFCRPIQDIFGFTLSRIIQEYFQDRIGRPVRLLQPGQVMEHSYWTVLTKKWKRNDFLFFFFCEGEKILWRPTDKQIIWMLLVVYAIHYSYSHVATCKQRSNSKLRQNNLDCY